MGECLEMILQHDFLDRLVALLQFVFNFAGCLFLQPLVGSVSAKIALEQLVEDIYAISACHSQILCSPTEFIVLHDSHMKLEFLRQHIAEQRRYLILAIGTLII